MKVNIITYNVNQAPRGGEIRRGAGSHPVPRNIFVFIFFVPMYRGLCKFRASFCIFLMEKCHVTN